MQKMEPHNKTKILIISTGGTITSVPGEDGSLRPATTVEELERAIPSNMSAHVNILNLCALDSSNVGPREWNIFAETIRNAAFSYNGIIVTHGTDTMAFTATALSFMLWDIKIPVILTGSQLPLGTMGSDAGLNLQNAIQAVLHASRFGINHVMLAFNGKVFYGARLYKRSGESFDAFSTAPMRHIGEFTAAGIEMNVGVEYHPEISLLDELSIPTPFSIPVLAANPGLSPDVLFLVGSTHRVTIIEGFGVGNLPMGFGDAIESVTKHGNYVIVRTPFPAERAQLKLYEVGMDLLNKGAIEGSGTIASLAVKSQLWLNNPHLQNCFPLRTFIETSFLGEF